MGHLFYLLTGPLGPNQSCSLPSPGNPGYEGLEGLEDRGWRDDGGGRMVEGGGGVVH